MGKEKDMRVIAQFEMVKSSGYCFELTLDDATTKRLLEILPLEKGKHTVRIPVAGYENVPQRLPPKKTA